MPALVVATVILWLASAWLLVAAVRRPGLMRTPRRLIAAGLCALLGTLLGAVLTIAHAFFAFAGESLVARVTVRRLAPERFELTYRPVSGEERARTIPLSGDQWFISGGMVKWHPLLTGLGVKSYHKPMRIGGQFSRLERQRAQPPTVYPLAPDLDRFWECLYRADRYLPFIEAVYGSSAYVYAEPDVTQEVYVTPSGYLIKRGL